ncbi:threonine/homoserine/homoserine lactone efflux protein [Agromyces hippuratus]|uniref:Threonine/homoserine/homoserine lactone efflux protein n=1 Tax=Agromyces hippuratus TaxID=286438 RepID=A0A852WWX4_9MICO|nr:LysE family transporter [Agromyces hippuratus]NYG22449.1 threonine/homoserine/homoserine lactone efflux protein [Agromyces hippuratus]
MNTQLLLACWAMMTFMVLVPGPDWAYIIASGLRDRSIVPALSGILIGYLAAVAAVAVGVGAAVAAMPWVLSGLTLAAAAYLAYLGIRVLIEPPGVVAGAAPGGGAETRPWLRLVQGAGVSGLNPKGLLVLVVLLPQFTDAAGAWPIPVQLAVLGLIFVGSCALVYFVVGMGARTVLRARPSAMRLVSRISGAAMVVLAVVLVVEQLSHLLG